MLKKRCKITFVVHGSTIYTATNRFYEVGEYPPLDDNGREEIERLALWLKKRSPKTDKIYTAPTLRSIQSANIISKSYEQSFEIIEDLITKDEGVWGGLSFSEIEEKYPNLLNEFHADCENFVAQTGESMKNFNLRANKIIKKIKTDDFGKRVIIVCDASFVRAIVAHTFNIPFENQNRLALQTGSATQINFYENWPILVYTNFYQL